MKTKNIFRMLLVAAALLMGANNAMADDWSVNFDNKVSTDKTGVKISSTLTNINGTNFGSVYWGDLSDSNLLSSDATATFTISPNVFANVNTDCKLKIYCKDFGQYYWSLGIIGGNNTNAEFTGLGSSSGYITINDPGAISNGYLELGLTEKSVEVLQSEGLKLDLNTVTISQIVLYAPNGGIINSKFVLQTETSWLLRTGNQGLYSSNSGSRAWALRNCQAGDFITINTTAGLDNGAQIDPTPNPQNNAVLRSQNGDNYKVLVTSDGDVKFLPHRYVMIHSISINHGYKITYYINNDFYKVVWYEEGETVNVEPNPEIEGFFFNGWSEHPSTMPGRDLEIRGSTSQAYNLNLVFDSQKGTVTTESTKHKQNDNISISVSANEGYEIGTVTCQDSNNNNISFWTQNPYTFGMPAADVTFTVTFNQIGSTPTPHNVYIANGIQGGSVTANPTSAAPGTTVTLTAQPNQGYRFASWNVYGNNQSIAVNNNQFTMPDYDVTVSANFEQIYTVSVSSGSNGSASVDKTTAAANETVTITTNPNSGYEVDAVTVANVNVTKDANVNNRYTFTMPANNVTVNVTFKVATQSPNFEILNNAIETVGSTDLTSPRYGGMSTPITIADGGTLVYKFRNNTDGQDNGHSWMVLAATSEANLSNPESNATVILRNDNWEIRAWNRDNITENFNWDTFINDMNGSDVTMTIQYTNGRFSVSSSIRTTGGTTYNYSYWKDIPGSPSQMVTCLSVEKAYLQITEATYTAPQEQSTTYTVTVNAGSGGTASADKQSYEAGETVTITTRPTNGYVVSSVTVAGEDADYVSTNTYSFTMPTNNVTVYVTFELETQGTPDQVVIGSTGYATYSNAENAINLSGLSGAKAYIATAISLEQNKVTLTQVRGVVAANTGLIIISDNKQPGTFNMPIALSTGTSYSNNLLLASDGNTTLSKDDSDYTYYVLVERSGVAKFAEVYSYDADLDAGKAYLRTDKVSHASARTRGLSIEINNGTTGINGVENEQRENVIYNLRGQRVENPTKGLYIINGKKVIIK